MRYLTLEEVLTLHAYQIEKFGGKEGLRDAKLLESAVLRPQTTFSGTDAYQTVYEKAAVLGMSLIQNHPFYDGNKRTGVHAMLVFLKLNGIDTTFSNKDLLKMGVQLAEGAISLKTLVKILKEKS